MGHGRSMQLIFPGAKVNWQFKDTHGGVLRKRRLGRKARPLSTKESIHIVFKVDSLKIKKGFRSHEGFRICNFVIKRYAKRFFVKIDQLAICKDHIHMVIKLTRRSQGIYFFRVVAGQIAQNFKNKDLWSKAAHVTDTPPKIWKLRPFTRVIHGWKAYNTARNYVILNEMEASGKIPYQKERLKKLKAQEWGSSDWQKLWS